MFCCVQVDGGRDGEGREQFSSIVNSGESPSKCWPNSSSFCPPPPPELSERGGEMMEQVLMEPHCRRGGTMKGNKYGTSDTQTYRLEAGALGVLNQMRQIL